jgi:hypothetical protein
VTKVLPVARNKLNLLPLKKNQVIKRYEHNECTVDIDNAMGIPELTLRNKRKQAKKLRKAVKVQS